MNRVNDDLVRDGLRHLSSLEMQTRLWLSSGETEWSSLEEASSQLFDDSGLGDALDRSETVFSPKADRQLRRLRSQLRSIDIMRAPNEVIDDPVMVQVRAGALQLLKEFYDG